MQISKSLFGLVNDQEILCYTISNSNNVSFTVIDYGATLISVKSNNNNNNTEEITLCCSNLDDLLQNIGRYYGCCVGRVANRIKEGIFSLDGITYNLAVNDRKNHLHGGNQGFNQRIWKGTTFQYNDMAGVELTYTSYDGEENYPGNVHVTVRYELTNLNNDLIISYHATTDKATPINLTNHTYWNLSGNCTDRVYDHNLQLSCSKYLPLNENQIPTGQLLSVQDTLFDFTSPKSLKDPICHTDGGGKIGLDHCFVIDQINDQYNYNSALQYDVYQNILKDTNNLTNMVDSLNKEGYLRHIATLSDPKSGRTLTVRGTQPGVQIYTANWLPNDTTTANNNNNNKNKNNTTNSELPYVMHNAICLETQHFPDAINQFHHNKDFTSIILRPEDGVPYFHQSVFTFSNLNS